jgi:hypothetical protein
MHRAFVVRAVTLASSFSLIALYVAYQGGWLGAHLPTGVAIQTSPNGGIIGKKATTDTLPPSKRMRGRYLLFLTPAKDSTKGFDTTWILEKDRRIMSSSKSGKVFGDDLFLRDTIYQGDSAELMVLPSSKSGLIFRSTPSQPNTVQEPRPMKWPWRLFAPKSTHKPKKQPEQP